MLNRILQTLFLCFAAFLLTTGIALGSPLPSSILVADYSLHAAELPPGGMAKPDIQATPLPQSADSPQTNAPGSTQAESDRDTKLGTELKDRQPTQADPSVPYDPYDYDVIREMNREIYGEKSSRE